MFPRLESGVGDCGRNPNLQFLSNEAGYRLVGFTVEQHENSGGGNRAKVLLIN